MEKSKTFIIIPVHKNGYQAPAIAIYAEKYEVALELAKKQSRLSDYPEVWSFM